jgi:hypothetical protein
MPSLRPPSYSDSYHILAKPGRPLLEPFILNPINDAVEAKEQEQEQEKEPQQPQDLQQGPCYHGIILFIIKGSLHIFFISTFETVFYFFFVSKSEDNGIKSAFNVYYTPLIQTCGNWTNVTHGLLEDYISYGPNKSVIDNRGFAATSARDRQNTELLNMSVFYSVFCLFLFLLMALIARILHVNIRWPKLLGEHFSFVLLLGAYEYFFFRTIIYRYSTLSTDEINQYIYDGIYQCLQI